jgi:hypothetical protein
MAAYCHLAPSLQLYPTWSIAAIAHVVKLVTTLSDVVTLINDEVINYMLMRAIIGA